MENWSDQAGPGMACSLNWFERVAIIPNHLLHMRFAHHPVRYAFWEIVLFLGLAIGPGFAFAQETRIPFRNPTVPLDHIWQGELDGFEADDYLKTLRPMIARFEKVSGRMLIPGEKRKVGLKVYTHSGPGIATPHPLVQACIQILQEKGFQRSEIFIIDLDLRLLWESGYISDRNDPEPSYAGVPVKIILDGNLFDPQWYYDSPIPSERFEYASVTDDLFSWNTLETDNRKSFLPLPLLLDVDFWINLPVITDHPALGINGVMANATLWNVSNQYRFLQNPMGASAAIAEIAAIPELRRGLVFSVVSLEKLQFIGGPFFNANYVRSSPELFLSANPVALDYVFLDRINRARATSGFRAVAPPPPVFDYAKSLGIGDYDPEVIQIEPVGSALHAQ